MTASFAPADPDRWSVRLSRRYPYPVEKVWQAVSRPEHLAAWFPSTVAFGGDDAPRVGSEVHFGEPTDGLPTGVVTDCDPPHLLAFTWDTDHLRFELSPVADGTELVLLHTFDDRAGAASFASGWEECIGAMGADLIGDPAPGPSRAERRHEELVAAFGLDAPVVDEADDAGCWRIVFERQMVAPAEVVWGLLLGSDPATGRQRSAPAVGDPFTPWAAPTYVLGTVTEVVPGQLLAWECSADEPGDAVRLALVEGTGHGARLLVTITGSVPADRDTARDQWHGGVANTAAEALGRALAVTPSSPS
jgi:uncharacterized protein YndB with AHSA1/START domain